MATLKCERRLSRQVFADMSAQGEIFDITSIRPAAAAASNSGHGRLAITSSKRLWIFVKVKPFAATEGQDRLGKGRRGIIAMPISAVRDAPPRDFRQLHDVRP
jgi:hypothetical protein